MRRLAATVLLACVSAAICAPVTLASTQVLASEPAASSISAYGGMVAWSHRSNGRFRLRIAYRGNVKTLRLRSRAVPFDVDVGPSASGRPVLVYSRCVDEPTSSAYRQLETELPAWKDARGCDIYRFNPRTNKEQLLRRLSSLSESETLPAIWRDHIAFAAVSEKPRRARVPRIAIATVNGRHRTRLGSGTRGRITGTPSDGLHPGPGSLDLRGSRTLVGWNYYGRSCEPQPTAEQPDPTASESLPAEILEWNGKHKRMRASSCDARSVFGAFWRLALPSWIRRNPEGTDTAIAAAMTMTNVASTVISAAGDDSDLYLVRRSLNKQTGYEIVRLGGDVR